jgi:hypothetical protein
MSHGFSRLVTHGLCAVLAASLIGLSPAPARADEPPSADRLKAAAEEYDRGRRAFLADDFDTAAVHFENAFRDAPRAETLRLAIRARRKAKQPARAATLAAVGQLRYADDKATAQLAKETLDEAAPQLNEYLVDCTSDCTIAADGRVVSQADATKHRIYLDPGPHELGVSFKLGGSVAKHIDAKKGGKDTLAFEAPPPPKVAPPPANGNEKPAVTPPPPPPESTKPLGPVVFFVAAGLTVAVGAGTVVSGIDAKNNPGVDAVRRACAGKDESCPEYQDGKAAETRTNVLLAVTGGAVLITAVIGIFFTQWSSPSTRSGTGTGTGTGMSFGAGPAPGGGGSVDAVGRF